MVGFELQATMRLLFLLTCLTTACQSPSIVDNCDTSDSLSGQMSARLNGDEWKASEVVWNQSGSSVQINTELKDEWRLSIVLQRSDSDETPSEAIGNLGPWLFDLSGGGGGWVTAYPQTGNSISSRTSGDGQFILQQLDDELKGCLEINTSDLTIESGRLNASLLGG